MSQKSKILFSSVIHYFKETYNPTLSGKENIKLNNRTHNTNQFSKKFKEEKDNIAKHAGMAEFYGLLEDISRKKEWSIDKSLEYMSDQVFGAIKQELTKASREKITKISTGMDMVAKALDYSNYLPVLDISSTQKILYNTKIGRINREATYTAWKEWVHTRHSEERQALMNTVVPAVIKYDPYHVEEVSYTKVQEQEEVLTLNAHITPEWRLKPKDVSKPPEIFTEFMDFLFPDENSRDYVYHWINFMLTDRNHCILFLSGEQGTGKGTLAYIVSELVGRSNFVKLGEDFWESRFNGELKYRRCVFFDDCEITKENVTRIRGMTNRTIAIESKGDTTLDLQNNASYMWAINPERKALITYDDRRYSVPLIASKNIEKEKGSEWMDKLYDLIDNDYDFIASIGNWILQHGDQGRYNNTKPFITDNFYNLVERALTLWQRFTIDTLESRDNDRYSLADDWMKEGLRGTGRTTLQGFLDTYKDKEGEPLGYIAAEGKIRYLYPTKKYFPEDMIEEFKNEEF